MPKKTKHPRLRTLVRRGAGGQRWVYYYFDMRPDGAKDIPLGKDYAIALQKWDELFNKKPRIKGTCEQAFSLWEEQVLPTYGSDETRRGYAKALRRLRPVFGPATWVAVKLPHLIGYLEKRSGKVQANREMSCFQIVWNYARKKGLTELPWPAAGMERSGWKNREQAREIEVTDEMFAAVYQQGDQVLRDAMDVASACGLRVTDVRTVAMPPAGAPLRVKASKTGKLAEFDVDDSPVLADVVSRRRANKRAMHLKLLTTPSGREVSYRMLHDRFVSSRTGAAICAYEAGDAALGTSIESMVLRDCRKYAASQAATLEEASRLLQHNDPSTTRRHYRRRAEPLKPVR